MRSPLVSRVGGFGHYVPTRKITSAALEQQLNLSPGWIEQRTGIRERRWVSGSELLVDLAEKAGVAALESANIAKKEIALTLLATSTPDHLLPPSSPLLAWRLGLSNSGAMDLAGACAGFLHALILADGFVRTQKKPVLVVAANILSRRLNFAQPESAVLFADAAGALVLVPSRERGKGVLGAHFLADGSGYHLISIPAGGSERPFSSAIPDEDYRMDLKNGSAIFTRAIAMMVQCAQHAMCAAGLDSDSIDYLVPHQANLRLLERVAGKLKIAAEKTVSTVCDYGNSSAASIPFSLSLAHAARPFAAGEKILLTAAGAGLTGGALVLGV